MRRTALACLSLAFVSLASAGHAGEVARDAEQAGASIGAGIGSIVGGAVDRIGRGIEAATAPRPAETVVIERRTVVRPAVPARPCVTTADGVRVCEGD
jgi:hypothetical protein